MTKKSKENKTDDQKKVKNNKSKEKKKDKI